MVVKFLSIAFEYSLRNALSSCIELNRPFTLFSVLTIIHMPVLHSVVQEYSYPLVSVIKGFANIQLVMVFNDLSCFNYCVKYKVHFLGSCCPNLEEFFCSYFYTFIFKAYSGTNYEDQNRLCNTCDA